MMNANTKAVRMSNRKEVEVEHYKQLGATTHIVKCDGKYCFAVYHEILNTLFVNDED